MNERTSDLALAASGARERLAGDALAAARSTRGGNGQVERRMADASRDEIFGEAVAAAIKARVDEVRTVTKQ
jgi:hypothetical protein